jgi:methenyltetrahydrofolate cyclohydrolase
MLAIYLTQTLTAANKRLWVGSNLGGCTVVVWVDLLLSAHATLLEAHDKAVVDRAALFVRLGLSTRTPHARWSDRCRHVRHRAWKRQYGRCSRGETDRTSVDGQQAQFVISCRHGEATGLCFTAVNFGEQSMATWLEQLADRTPTPGGGAVAAVLAATSAALLSMVANYTKGLKFADHEPRVTAMLTELTALRAEAVRLADDDDLAFTKVVAAYKLPRATEEERSVRSVGIQTALQAAAAPPAEVGRVATILIALAEELSEFGNANVISDIAVASVTARAAMQSAVLNIDVNRFQICDEMERERLRLVVEDLHIAVERADIVTARIGSKLR